MRRYLLLVLLLVGVPPAWAVGVQLAWDYENNPLDPAAVFVVYKDTDCLGVFFAIATVPYVGPASQTYTDTGPSTSPLLPGHNYCYQVTAKAADGEESGASNTITFQVQALAPAPNAPTNLRGVAIP